MTRSRKNRAQAAASNKPSTDKPQEKDAEAETETTPASPVVEESKRPKETTPASPVVEESERPKEPTALLPPYSRENASRVFPAEFKDVCGWSAPRSMVESFVRRDCDCLTHWHTPPLWPLCLDRLSVMSGESWDDHDQLLAWMLQAQYKNARNMFIADDHSSPLEVSTCGRHAVMPVGVFFKREPVYAVFTFNKRFEKFGARGAAGKYWYFVGWYTDSRLAAHLAHHAAPGIKRWYAPAIQQLVGRSRVGLFNPSLTLGFNLGDHKKYYEGDLGATGDDFADAVAKSYTSAKHSQPWLCWLNEKGTPAFMAPFVAAFKEDSPKPPRRYIVFVPGAKSYVLHGIFDQDTAYAATRAVGAIMPTRYRPSKNTASSLRMDD